MAENSRTAARRSSDAGAGVQSVDRAISVLEILARSGAAGVSEIAAEIGVHKSTAFRLLAALEERHLAEQTHDRGKYQLGFGILRLANAIPARLDLVRLARPVLEDLAARLDETVNVAVVRDHFAVNVDHVPGSAAVASQNWTGRLTPLHATSSGKVLLAHASGDQRDLLTAGGLPRFTERTITDLSVLRQQLDQALVDGYATTREEYEIGLNAVAVPVRDHTGAVSAALSVSGPAYRLDDARIHAVLADLLAAAERISSRMGYFG